MIFFRPAPSASVFRNAACTLAQTVGMWGVFLGLLPALVLVAQERAGIARFEPGTGALVAAGLFWAAGLTGIYCGTLFVRYGAGTPFPLDETTRLVIVGPYRFIRNPMAILGIFQGAMVGWWLGSWPVMVYAACGTLAWHWLARPYEELDMERRFGAPYLAYKQAVRNWVPSVRPYPRFTGAAEVEAPSADAC